MRNLLDLAISHAETPDGKNGFVHPVIEVRAGKGHQKAKRKPDGTVIPARDVHHFDFGLIDWLHEDGKTLLSSRINAELDAEIDAESAAPWEDDSEKEFFGAA